MNRTATKRTIRLRTINLCHYSTQFYLGPLVQFKICGFIPSYCGGVKIYGSRSSSSPILQLVSLPTLNLPSFHLSYNKKLSSHFSLPPFSLIPSLLPFLPSDRNYCALPPHRSQDTPTPALPPPSLPHLYPTLIPPLPFVDPLLVILPKIILIVI